MARTNRPFEIPTYRQAPKPRVPVFRGQAVTAILRMLHFRPLTSPRPATLR